ncbi:DNA phosphorothioation system sulfurtransferase DndC [Desulfovibrio mangrovi]|uniref:DNA phosphorothioation system sulfurtransferase DndC n=1 Tax=Desulfovibrio mangrovi TaxID=2976983 RepID=UPI0022486A69|nr:DNA phosphorothioation system sulfurtransferase DndC [Desulfovibrio mangrovi]UZP67640.1 DNA phosphorothioation system sulfurtransferase DndC [Desulfovibrio mangrovi]
MSQAECNPSPKDHANLIELIKETYLADGRPWIIGFSGGKDSTCVLQLVWTALSQIPPDQRTKKVYSISSDTFVEMPLIEEYLHKKIHQLNQAAKLEELPIQAIPVCPDIDETFWVNMIGRGYPAPYRTFRWCTDRMKIKPTSRFIKEQIASHGEVVVVLGVRKSESSARAGSMQEERVTDTGKRVGRKMVGKYLSQHKDLPSALVFSPIEEWSTEDVWDFLRNCPPPWGGDHSQLEVLYRNAQKADDDGEDELAEQTFGNSRFGCWTCTVVQRDLSMEAFIEKGEKWLAPLLKFRDDLMITFERDFKLQHREHRRRTGQVLTKEGKDGNTILVWGPFTLEYRKKLLTKLLRTQQEVRQLKNDSRLELVKREELLRIRQLWRTEEADWADSLPVIFETETGEPFNAPRDDWSGMGKTELELLKEVCEEHQLPLGLLTDLFDVEKRHNGMSRRSQIFNNIHSVFSKDWRTREEVFQDIGFEASLENTGVGDILHAAEKNNAG